MCLIESNRADASNTKFGLRTMKSLRKTILLLGLAPLALVSAPLLAQQDRQSSAPPAPAQTPAPAAQQPQQPPDRKSTRLNSSHRCISYAVFCLKIKMWDGKT